MAKWGLNESRQSGGNVSASGFLGTGSATSAGTRDLPFERVSWSNIALAATATMSFCSGNPHALKGGPNDAPLTSSLLVSGNIEATEKLRLLAELLDKGESVCRLVADEMLPTSCSEIPL